MDHIFFIHSSFNGYLDCFHVLAIVNSAAWTLGCTYPFRSCFSPDICPGVGLLDHQATLLLGFVEPPYCYPWAVLSCFSCVRLFAILWTIACQVPLSMGFSRQEYWSELPCSPPGDLLDPEMEPAAPVAPALQADSLLLSHRGSPLLSIVGATTYIPTNSVGGFSSLHISWESLSDPYNK